MKSEPQNPMAVIIILFVIMYGSIGLIALYQLVTTGKLF